MSWTYSRGTFQVTPMTCITGMATPVTPDSHPQPFTYTVPPPKPRAWVNRDDAVWILTIEYRKPSLGDAGVLGTYRTHERAREELSEWVMERFEREITDEEWNDGVVYTEDETVEIVEQTLE